MKYTPSTTYTHRDLDPADLRSIAEDVLGPVNWRTATMGLIECPGVALHSKGDKEKDCRVNVDGIPTVHCFHDSCESPVAEANHELRSAVGKAECGTRPPPPKPSPKSEFSKFMRACFLPSDIVSIVDGMEHEDGRVGPGNSGCNVSSCAEWVERADKAGEIDKVWTSRHGLYIRVNPVKYRSRGLDRDVTSYRHTLVESDDMPKTKQESLLRSSGLPISALIDSGGKSVHAWVKVDARDIDQYKERVAAVHDRLKAIGFSADEKNVNPARLARAAGGRRGDVRQKLLGVNLGPASWHEWREGADDVAKPLTVAQLADFPVDDDPNCVIGQRWLCKGGSLVIVGQSGIGKSSLLMQMACGWGLGNAVFGIRPKRPLRSIIIQEENDEGDLAEMFGGVAKGMQYSADDLARLDDSLLFFRESERTGPEFAEFVERMVDRHAPDVVWIDPLLSYIGGDISKQEVSSGFLRGLLNPISRRTGCIFALMHHTGKPKDSRGQSGWTDSDDAYAGIGSSDITNWARAILYLKEVGGLADGVPETFRLAGTKRGKRSGMIGSNGEEAKAIFLRHGLDGICWTQCPPPETKKDERGNSGRSGRGRPKKADGYDADFAGKEQLTNDEADEIADRHGVARSTIRRAFRSFRAAQDYANDL